MRDFDTTDRLFVAAVDLVGRTGARSFEIGYLHDDVPIEDAAWYAHAQFRGARITAEGHRSPSEAAHALAMRILTGAKCRCGRLVALADDGAYAYLSARMSDGSTFTLEKAIAAGLCRWRLIGDRWLPSCPEPPKPARMRKPRRRPGR